MDVDVVYNKAKFQDVFDLIQKERVSNIDTVNKRKDGALFPSEVTVTGYRINDKPYMFAALRDISGRKQTEQILREREERYRRLFEDSPISLWEEDYSGVKTYINSLRDSGVKDFREYFKDHPQAVADCAAKVRVVDINKATTKLFEADDKDSFIDGIGNVFTKETYGVFTTLLIDMANGKTTFESEAAAQTLTGEKKYISMRLSVVPGHEETWLKVLASVIDMTGRVQSEEEQSRLQQRLEAQWEIARMVDTDEKTLSDLVLNELVSMTVSKYGFYGFFNKDESIMTSYSWTKEVMKDCKIYEKPVEFPIKKSGVWGNAVRERKTIIINNYRNGNYPNKKGLPEGHVPINRILAVPIFRYNHIVALGAVADKANDYTEKDAEQMNAFLHSAQIIQDKRRGEEELKKHRELLMELVEERTYELLRINEELQQEIAERKLAEAEALRASQLASLGELAAGVAHEINNPVNGIINYTQILFNKSEAGSKEHDIAERIIREGDRIADIIKSLLSFARDNKDKKHPVHINEIISESLALTETQIKKDGIHLRVKVSPDLPKIVAQPQQIEQVFLNIISNARYALNQKYPEEHDNKTLEIKADKAIINNEPHIRTIFYDKGSGIPDEIQGKIINPFFSTKSDSHGTGLGLSISHGIISDHSGRLSIDSVNGEFTRITIDLPAEKKM
jgi:signal transduction histidine kinase/PAS domain-containing protein